VSFRLLNNTDFLACALDDIDAFLKSLRAGLGIFGIDRENLEGDFAIFQVLQVPSYSESVTPGRKQRDHSAHLSFLW